MRIVIQRVLKARVRTNKRTVGKIKNGLVLFIGIFNGDTNDEVDFLIKKIISLRIFNDNSNKMNLSVSDVQGSILAISQFTLCASTNYGRRPSYLNAMAPNQSKDLYDYFTSKLKETGLDVQKGMFGADMEVDLINDGPATFVLDSKKT